ncbi:MAG: autotransporter-associated beta strand repeat-containing protein [Verrucomicrobiota bacterium]
MMTLRKPLLFFSSALISTLFITTAHSQSDTWDGETNAFWQTATNWAGDTVPGNTSNAIATFSGDAGSVSNNTTIDLGGTVGTGGILFDTASAASYTIGTVGDILQLFVNLDNSNTNDADIIVNASVTANQTIAADIALGDGTGTTGFQDENRITNSSGTSTLLITGDIAAGTGGTVPGATARLWLNGGGDITVSGNINETPVGTSADGIDMFIANAGTKTFSGTFTGSTNNYLRTFIRDGGTLTLATGANIGTGDLEVRSGTLNIETATLQLDNSLLLGSTSQGTGDANINISNSSTLILNSNLDYLPRTSGSGTANEATIAGGTIQLAGADRFFTVTANPAFTGSEIELTISSNITNDGSSRSLIKNNTGTLLLSGTNDFGTTRINNGTLIVDGGNALGDDDLVEVDPSGGEGILQLNASETIGSVNGTGNINLQSNTLTVGDGTSTTFSGLISGTGGGLVKQGAGNLTLSSTGTQTYTGDTTVNAGTLIINSSTLSSNITVNNGGNLGGEFTTSGNLIFAGTNHTIEADASTANSLGTSATLDTSAPTLITVNLTGTASGNIPILTYGSINGNATSNVSNFALGANSASLRGGSIVDTGSAIAVSLGFLSNTWQGNDGTNPNFWDNNGTSNWTNGTDSVYLNGDAAVFDDTASSFTPILQENITAETVTFNNNSNAYTISANNSETLTVTQGIVANNAAGATISANVVGTGGLQISGTGNLTLSGTVGNGGSGGITKTGTGSTTITGLIDDTGARTVTEGSLILTDGAFPTAGRTYTTGDGTNGTLIFDGAISTGGGLGTVSGNGTFRKTGSGTLTFFSSGATISMGSEGLISVDEGLFSFGGDGAGNWASNLADMNIESGATFNGQNTALIIDALTGGGTLLIGANGTDALTLGISGGSGVFTGNIGVAGRAANDNSNLTKVGAGTQTLNGTNTYTGATTVSAGQLNIGGTNQSTITVAAGANLGGEGSTTGNIIYSGTSYTLDIDAGTSAALGSTSADLASIDFSNVIDDGFTINIEGTGSGNITVLDYGGGFSGNLSAFALGTNTTSGRGGAGTFLDDTVNGAIVINLGFLTNTWQGTDGTNPTFWDNGVTSNWDNGQFFDGDDAIFDETASNFNPTLQGNITANDVTFTSTGTAYTVSGNSGTETLTVTGALNVEDTGNVTLDVSLAGDAEIAKSGSGILALTQANTFTGNTTVSAGSLALGVSNTLADTSTITHTGGNVLLADGVTETVSTYVGTGGLLGLGFSTSAAQGGDAELILTSDSSINNIQVGTNGNLTLADGVTATVNTVSQLGGSDTFTLNVGTGGFGNITGAINSGDGDGSFTKTGAGTARVSANNSAYGGTTLIENGTLEFVSIRNYNEASSLGDGDNNGANDSIIKIGSDSTSATLQLTAVGANSTDRNFQIGDAGGIITIDDSGSSLTISGTVVGNGTAGNGALTKAGSGNLTLTGTNTYSGGTNINSGTLQIGNGGATGTIGTGNVTNNGTLIFNRTGDYSVADITGTGTTTINAGNLTLTGTNYTNNTTVGTGANLLGEAVTSGTLTFDGPTHEFTADLSTGEFLGTTSALDVSSANITVNVVGTGAGNITVLDYGTINGGIGNFALGTNSASARGASIANTGSEIVVSLGFVDNVWQGNDGTNPNFWDVNTTSNWSNTAGSLTSVFLNGDAAVFDDTASSFTPTLTVGGGGNISADSLTFNNNSNAYTISANSTEELIVAQGITATGTAASNISAPVTMTAGSNITNTGTGTLTLVGNVTGTGLSTEGSGNIIFSGELTGTGGLTKNGTGTTTFTDNPTFTGDTTVNAGTLKFEGQGADHDGVVYNHTIASGAVVEYDTAGSGRTIGSAGGFGLSGNGTFRKTGAETLSFISSVSNWAMGADGLIDIQEGVLDFGGQNPGNVRNNLSDMNIANGAIFDGQSTAIVIDVLTGSGTFRTGGSERGTQTSSDGFGLTLGISNGSGTFDGNISNATDWGVANGYGTQGAVEFAVVKTGTGTQILNGNNSYTGITNVEAGALVFNGDNSAANGNVTVSAGATLGGSGTIGGNATISGAHTAGGNITSGFIGQQTLAGNLTYTGGASTVAWDLISQSSTLGDAGSQFDQWVVQGTVDFANTTTLSLSFNGTGSSVDWTNTGFWGSDQSWILYDNANAPSNFNNLTLNVENWQDSNGAFFDTVRGPNGSSFALALSGNDIVLNYTAIPEPSTYALMGLGLAAFGWFMRRRRRRQAAADEAV